MEEKGEKIEFKDIAKERYATKKFDGSVLSEEKISSLLEIIRLSASSLGLQPWKVKVIADAGTKERLLPVSNNQAQVTTCSHLLVFCMDTNVTGHIDSYSEQMRKQGIAEDKIASLVEARKAWMSKKSNEQIASWARDQTFIALGNAINGAKSLGFDSCPMGGFDPEGYSRELNLSGNLTPVVLCPVGYAADTPKPKIRLSKEDLFF